MASTRSHPTGFEPQPNSAMVYKTFSNREGQVDHITNGHSEGSRYTMQEAIDHIGFGKFQIKISFIVGLFYMSEAMEIMVLVILAPVLECSWQLSPFQESALSTAVFVGSMISANMWGKMCDKYGRKSTLLLAAAFDGYFGLLSCLSPHFGWLLALRLLVGVGLGSAVQGITYYSEFLPTANRSHCVILLNLLWTLGTCLTVAIATLLIPTVGWRWFLVVVAGPSLAFCCLAKFFPESPRFHLAHGHYQKALEQMESIARANGKELPCGILYDPCTEKVDQNKLGDIWTRQYRFLTFLVSVLWVTGNFMYFGTAILTTELFELKDGCHGYNSGSAEGTKSSCSIHCVGLSTSDYLDILLTTIGEAPGIFLSMLLVHRFGRRRGIFTMAALYACTMAVSSICTPRSILVAILCVARALNGGITQSVVLYTSEVYPTSVRALAMGWGIFMNKCGVTVTPFVSQGLIATSAYIPIVVYCAMGCLCAGSALLLPVETADKSMPDTIDG